MRIVIVGLGAMGCLFAAHLSATTDIILFGHWPAQLSALRRHGLTLIHSNGRHSQHLIPATNRPQEVGTADVALIMVKSRQTKKAAHELAQMQATNCPVISLQNGLGNRETLAAALANHNVTIGSTAQGATMMQPGVVRHAGQGPTHLAITEATAVVLNQLATHLNQAGLETIITTNVDSLIWGKLAVNAGINPLTALLRVSNGALLENDSAREQMCSAAEEVAAVAAAQGITLPYASATQRVIEVAQATAANHSSMLQDVLRGAPTEIEAICGSVVRYGRDYNVPTPVNAQLLEQVLAIYTN